MFFLASKILNNKISVSILSNNTNKLLGMRQQGGAFTHMSRKMTNVATITGSDSAKLGRWNWI